MRVTTHSESQRGFGAGRRKAVGEAITQTVPVLRPRFKATKHEDVLLCGDLLLDDILRTRLSPGKGLSLMVSGIGNHGDVRNASRSGAAGDQKMGRDVAHRGKGGAIQVGEAKDSDGDSEGTQNDNGNEPPARRIRLAPRPADDKQAGREEPAEHQANG